MIQPLNDRVPIINPDGTPTQFFLRQLQERGITTDSKITAEQAAEIAQEIVEEWSADRDINVTAPITGGGPLNADVTIGHDVSGVTPGTYGDATHSPQLTVDAEGHVTSVTDIPISGGGGGGSWTLVSTTTIAAPTANVPVTGLAAYSELLIICRNLTSSVSGVRRIQVSVDNGSSYFNGASDYLTVNENGVEANAATPSIGFNNTNSTAARTLISHIKNLKGPVRAATVNNTVSQSNFLFVGSTSDINAIRVDNHTGGNLTAGVVYVYGK